MGTVSSRRSATARSRGGHPEGFELTADDGAERKDGSDDGLDISALASKGFTWQ